MSHFKPPMRKKRLKIVAFILITIFVIYNLLLSDFNPMFEDDEFIYLTNKLKETEKQDLKFFVDAYKKVNEKNKYRRCECEVATTYIGPYRHGRSITKMIYVLKIEREFSNDQCLKFQFLNADYLSGNKGIKDAAKFYFKKNLEQLNEEEKLILIVMLDNPTLYNPIRRKEKVMNKVRLYKEILNNKNGS